jgi:putative membrane protein insertion efficiency factor
MKKLAIILVDFYRNILSFLKIRSCRFHPTCSAYAREAITKYGFLKGAGLSLKRICSCHQLNPGGYDPVP